MNFNDVKKDADARSKFAKLEKDVPTKIKFLSEDFKKIEKEFNGKPSVKYELPCEINGSEKLYQGSASFYSKCMVKANNRNKKLTDLVYIVTKTGEGLSTDYDVDVADNVLRTEVVGEEAPF